MAYEYVATSLVKDTTEVLTYYLTVARSGSRRETMYRNEQSLLVCSNSQWSPFSFVWHSESLPVLYLYDSSSNSTMVLLRLCTHGYKYLVVNWAREHVRSRLVKGWGGHMLGTPAGPLLLSTSGLQLS